MTMNADNNKGEDILTFHFEKVGLLIGICRRSFDCLKLLLVPKNEHRWSRNLLTNPEIL